MKVYLEIGFDGTQKILIVINLQLRVHSALQKYPGSSKRQRLFYLLEDYFFGKEIAFPVFRLAIEIAESTSGDTNICVVDIAIDEEGDDTLRVQSPTDLVSSESNLLKLGRSEQQQRLLLTDPLSAESLLDS